MGYWENMDKLERKQQPSVVASSKGLKELKEMVLAAISRALTYSHE